MRPLSLDATPFPPAPAPCSHPRATSFPVLWVPPAWKPAANRPSSRAPRRWERGCCHPQAEGLPVGGLP